MSIKKIFTAFLFSLAVLPVAIQAQTVAAPKEKSIWVWDSPLSKDSSYRNNMFYKLREDGFTAVKIDIIDFLSLVANGGNIETSRESYSVPLENFIKEANSYGLFVDVVAGNPYWVESSQRFKPLLIMDFALYYNSTHLGYPIRSIDFDIEPHVLPYYETQKNKTLTQYIQTVDLISTRHKSTSTTVGLSFTLPHFFDDKQKWTPIINYSGQKLSTFSHVLNILSSVSARTTISLMSYRNFATGKNGSIEISKAEISEATAKKSKTSIIVAQEVGDVDPAYVTFFGLCKSDLSRETTLIASAFATSTAFGGMSINYFDPYDIMCTK